MKAVFTQNWRLRARREPQKFFSYCDYQTTHCQVYVFPYSDVQPLVSRPLETSRLSDDAVVAANEFINPDLSPADSKRAYDQRQRKRDRRLKEQQQLSHNASIGLSTQLSTAPLPASVVPPPTPAAVAATSAVQLRVTRQRAFQLLSLIHI